MNDTTPKSGLHPMIWIASLAVTAAALAGFASFTGLISHRPEQPAAAAAPVVQAAAPAPVAVPQAVAAAPAPEVKPKVVTKTVVVREYVNRPSNERVYSSNDRGANGNERVYSSRPAINDMPPPPAAICRSCGVVEFVKADTHEADGSGLGAVAGGVLGGVLGNGIGQGNGRSLATVAGVIGGAMIGNKVEKTQRQSTTWQVGVRLEDGNLRLVNSNTEPPWHTGDRVKLIDGAIAPRV